MLVVLLLIFLVFPILMLLPAFMLWAGWTWYGIGVTYFSFLPEQFHVVPFWDCFFLIMVLGTVGSAITGSYGRSLSYNKKD